jgi:hypothetical protein
VDVVDASPSAGPPATTAAMRNTGRLGISSSQDRVALDHEVFGNLMVALRSGR